MPGLVSLGDGVGLAQSNRVVATTTYDIYDEDGQLVGYITGFERSDNRPTDVVRHCSSADAGRIIEQVPRPEEVTIRVTGFALYNKIDLSGRAPHYSLAARLSKGTGASGGFGGTYLFKSLNSQKIPFTVRQEEIHPTTQAKSVTYFVGCMLQNYTKPQSLANITIAETATIRASWVDEKASAVPAQGIVVGA